MTQIRFVLATTQFLVHTWIYAQPERNLKVSYRLICIFQLASIVIFPRLEPDHCPSTHPVQMRNACCKTIWRKDEGDCDGGRISDDDDPKCCQEEYLFQTQMCQVHKKRCVALSSSLGISTRVLIFKMKKYVSLSAHGVKMWDLSFFSMLNHLNCVIFLPLAPYLLLFPDTFWSTYLTSRMKLFNVNTISLLLFTTTSMTNFWPRLQLRQLE